MVKAEDSWLRGRGFEPPTEETIFQAPFIWIKKPGAKIEWKLTRHCCICCNPAKGRVDFEDCWLIKPSIITKDEMKLVSQPGPNSLKKKKKSDFCYGRPWQDEVVWSNNVLSEFKIFFRIPFIRNFLIFSFFQIRVLSKKKLILKDNWTQNNLYKWTKIFFQIPFFRK